MYRLLEIGEPILEGDEVYSSDFIRREIDARFNICVTETTYPVRRKLETKDAL